METELEHKNHNVHMEFHTAGHTQPRKTGRNVEKEFFVVEEEFFVVEEEFVLAHEPAV